MRILVVNPNTSPNMTADIDRAAQSYANVGTELTTVCPDWGPRSIEGHVEEALAAAATVETVAARRENYDGFVIACYGDPGLAAAREITTAPVIGIAEASMLTACTVAHRFSIVTVLRRIVPMLNGLIQAHGFQTRCASIRATPLSVLDIEADPQRAITHVRQQAQRALDEDGAEAICLGCAGMGPLDTQLHEQLDVPVIDGVATAVKMVELVGAYGLTTSKVAAYQHPEAKEFPGCPIFTRSLGQQPQHNSELRAPWPRPR